MLPIRFADPGGGPPWGLRLIRTSRGDTCVQLGRVENGRLGTLGIDGAWHNDHRFHPIEPNDTLDDVCGATDAAGHGFVSMVYGAAEASADASIGRGQAPACNPADNPARRRRLLEALKAPPRKGSALWELLERHIHVRLLPACPKDERLIMVGLLGPDATSVTYRTPSGRLARERTAGGVGAYLIVLPRTAADSCEYGGVEIPNLGCGSGAVSGGGALDSRGAITGVTYRNGSSCSVAPPSGLAAAYNVFTARVARLPAGANAQWLSLRRQFYAAEHVNGRNLYEKLLPSCPLVGWVRAKATVTAADVAAPLTVHVEAKPHGACYGSLSGGAPVIACERVAVSFVAREPVTRDGSGYEVNIRLADGGGEGQGTGADVHAGQRLRFHFEFPVQRTGVYRITVTYTPPQDALKRPIQRNLQLRTGGLVVGRARFTVSKPH